MVAPVVLLAAKEQADKSQKAAVDVATKASANRKANAVTSESSTRLTKLDVKAGEDAKLKQAPVFDATGEKMANVITSLDLLSKQADLFSQRMEEMTASTQVMQNLTDSYETEKERSAKRSMQAAIAARTNVNKKRASDKPQLKQRIGLRTL